MASSTNRKRATAADIAAAVKLGAIAPDAEVATADELAEVRAEAAEANRAEGQAARDAEPKHIGTEHECAIPGCRHGAAHTGIVQPDRQVKLQCPNCGAVARMTSGAIARTNGTGIVCGLDGVPFIPSARRTYSRKV